MDGIIVINKTKGCTSHDVVNKVKRIFKTKVGHTGTLDPNATGAGTDNGANGDNGNVYDADYKVEDDNK